MDAKYKSKIYSVLLVSRIFQWLQEEGDRHSNPSASTVVLACVEVFLRMFDNGAALRALWLPLLAHCRNLRGTLLHSLLSLISVNVFLKQFQKLQNFGLVCIRYLCKPMINCENVSVEKMNFWRTRQHSKSVDKLIIFLGGIFYRFYATLYLKRISMKSDTKTRQYYSWPIKPRERSISEQNFPVVIVLVRDLTGTANLLNIFNQSFLGS